MSDWQRIEAIFGRALELESAERSAYLDRTCADDPVLRAEVESLLASDADASPTFLDQPLETGAGLAGAELPEPPGAGETVGAYRLVERLGEGGMGVVYLAQRADGAFERQVAVKVLRAGLRGEQARRRFDLERRILAELDHPGIARLLDGGTTPAGAPFVVMERVEGDPIDRYCEHHALTVEERVDLVIEVCDAVAAAHRSLVVHRDLKPSNILVDRQGRSKLLDFGIAKILDPDQAEALGAQGAETTVGWQRVLTPNYSSPEQLRGERITVATDVFLLGILLYKLLTGELPHRLADRSLHEVETILTEQVPEAPSRRLRRRDREGTAADTGAPSGLSRIDPDLDLVVLKALRGDPADRYPSVEALVADLRRLRQGFPIEARTGNRRYLLRKFVGRHRRTLALATTALGLLTLFAADRAIQVERREVALDRAEASLERSETLRQFVEGLFWEADPEVAKGSPLTVVEALDRGEAKLELSPGAPAARASMHALLGQIRYDLGDLGAAQTHLEHALELFDSLDRPEAADRVAELRALGALSLVRFHQGVSYDDGDAEAVRDEALGEALAAYEESRYLTESEPELAFELSDPLAEIYCWLGRYDEAAPLTAEALELIRRAGEPRTVRVAVALTRRALVLKNRDGDLAAARELYQRALEMFRELEGPTYPEVANTLNQLALVSEALGNLEEARALHREVLEIRRRLYGGPHWEIGQSLQHLGELAAEAGDHAVAVSHFEELVPLTVELYGTTDGRSVKRALLLSQALIDTGRIAEAEAHLRTQLDEEHREARPKSSRLILWAEGALGVVLLTQGDDAGRDLLASSLDALRAKPSSYEGAIAWLAAQSEGFSPGG